MYNFYWWLEQHFINVTEPEYSCQRNFRFGTGCTGNCHLYNFRCNQWCIYVTVMKFPFQWLTTILAHLVYQWHVIYRVVELFNSSPRDKMAAILVVHDIFKCIFVNENDRIPIQISLKCVHRSPMHYKSALVPVMAWSRTGDKPLSEPMLTQFIDAYMRHSGGEMI